jgi:hypothetical protein
MLQNAIFSEVVPAAAQRASLLVCNICVEACDVNGLESPSCQGCLFSACKDDGQDCHPGMCFPGSECSNYGDNCVGVPSPTCVPHGICSNIDGTTNNARPLSSFQQRVPSYYAENVLASDAPVLGYEWHLHARVVIPIENDAQLQQALALFEEAMGAIPAAFSPESRGVLVETRPDSVLFAIPNPESLSVDEHEWLYLVEPTLAELGLKSFVIVEH